MKKNLLFLLFIILTICNLQAGPVNQATALKAARHFVGTTFAEGTRSDAMELVATTGTYYVYNVGTTGFVIVSADDCFRPIVGYSDEGVFPVENPSPEMMYYLDDLSKGREVALQHAFRQEEAVADEWQRMLGDDPMPLRDGERKAFYLVQTRWDQNTPYNKFCPSEGGRTYAGCVATAMSQVMNYWSYPTHGFGQHSYTHYQYGVLSADFSAAEYRFDLMPNTINEQSPVENIDAIALFMYHCGIAVDMGYGTDGSGAYSEDVPEAVLKYFGYSNCCRLVYRDQCSLGEFQALLKNQFDMGWPTYYSGSDLDQNVGHAFVCDGYDENDLFHFNWGWSGSGNGFFAIDELNVSSYAFNSSQTFIANYVPASVFTKVSKAPERFTAIPNGDEGFSVTLSWTNPTSTLEGATMETIDAMVVMRDGVAIQVMEHPAPGEAMTFVDQAGLPITVNYSVYAVYQGVDGRKAQVKGVNLGPACNWTVNLRAGMETGWGDGKLVMQNSSGKVLAELTATRSEESFEVEVPVGRITLWWTSPTDSIEVGVEIVDGMGQNVFSYNGPSTLMPQGLFHERINTCGELKYFEAPSDLKAEVADDDVVLQWKGVAMEDPLYIVYRDGFFYTMVHDVNTFTDLSAAQDMHSYFITAFSPEGESDPSNVVSAVAENELDAPRDLDFEILPNGSIKLTWTAPEQREQLAGFEVYRKINGDDFKRVKALGTNGVSYTDNTHASFGNKIYYKVMAVYRERGFVMSAPARSLRYPDHHYVEVNLSIVPYGLRLEEQEGDLLLQWDEAWLAESYNVYRNGERIAEGLTETAYSFPADNEPAYFQVTGVKDGVESSPSYQVGYACYAVEENQMVEAALYPNPSNGLTLVEAQGIRNIGVYSVTGQHLFDCQGTGDKAVVDLRGQKPGVYFLRISTNRGEQVKKLVLMQTF